MKGVHSSILPPKSRFARREGRIRPYRSRVIACIPAYNEERNIAKVVIRTQEFVDEVIVVDDGSTDLTATIAERLGAKVIRHEKNMGYGAALRTGFECAAKLNPNIVITIDADDQHNPEDISRLVKPIQEGETDVIIGSRFLEAQAQSTPTYRKLGIKIITALTRKAAYRHITDAQSGYRAYNGKIIRSLLPSETGMGASTEILLKAKDSNLRIREVPCEMKYHKESSKGNPLYHGLDVVISLVKYASIRRPLLFYGTPGATALLVGLFFWAWQLKIFSAIRKVVTNITLIAIAATVIGLLLLMTAMILYTMTSIIRENVLSADLRNST